MAVVVTYHRPELLQRCLQSLWEQRLQPGDALEVLVVDNACTDHTPELLRQAQANHPQLHVLRLPENGGGAGGFHHGMRWACTQAPRLPDQLWLLDDDTLATATALAELLRCRRRFEAEQKQRPAFVCSQVLWLDDSVCEMNIPMPVWDWNRFHGGLQGDAAAPTLVNSCSFVSVLMATDQVARVGLPIEAFFIWSDDQEYTLRLCKLGYPGLYAPASVVHHHTKENRGVNPVLMRPGDVPKYRYGMRNGAYLNRCRNLPRGLYYVLCRSLDIGRARISWGAKLRLWLALLDGLVCFRPRIVRNLRLAAAE